MNRFSFAKHAEDRAPCGCGLTQGSESVCSVATGCYKPIEPAKLYSSGFSRIVLKCFFDWDSARWPRTKMRKVPKVRRLRR